MGTLAPSSGSDVRSVSFVSSRTSELVVSLESEVDRMEDGRTGMEFEHTISHGDFSNKCFLKMKEEKKKEQGENNSTTDREIRWNTHPHTRTHTHAYTHAHTRTHAYTHASGPHIQSTPLKCPVIPTCGEQTTEKWSQTQTSSPSIECIPRCTHQTPSADIAINGHRPETELFSPHNR